MNESTSQSFLNVRKSDSARKLLFTLSDNGKAYQIGSGCTAVFRAKKPDGTILYNNCSINGNVIEYELTNQTISAEGIVECEVTLYGNDGRQITSPRFNIVVNDTIYADDEVESQNEFTQLTQAILGANNLNIEVEKSGDGTAITITKKDGTSEQVIVSKIFFLNVFVITETEVITNKTYAEIKAAIDAGDIIYITDKNGIVYTPQVGTTNTKIELLWIESQYNRTLYWTAVVDSENAWSAAEFELVEIDKLVFELSDKVDKETGKGLSTNDYTYADKAKVDAIPASPKYTDTVYNDTAVKNRLTAIENKENVTLTPNTARISNVSCTAKYFPLLGMVFVRIYGKICADLNVGYDYDLFTVGSRVPDSNAALSVKCGKNAMALAKTSSNGSAIQISPLESGINGYDVYITGFWFV